MTDDKIVEAMREAYDKASVGCAEDWEDRAMRAALSVARPMIEAEARRSNIAVKTGPGAILTEDGRAWIPRHKIRES